MATALPAAPARSQGVRPEAVGYLAEVRSRAYWKSNPLLIRAQLQVLPSWARRTPATEGK